MATTIIRKPAAIAEAQSGKNPNKVYDSVDELFNDLDAEK